MDLNNKKILLTNYTIANYTGSEINCLSLACALKQMGAVIEVATLNYAYPIRTDYEKAGIRVKNVFFDPLDYDEYDIIWAHHRIILSYLLFELHISGKKIIFSSLSPFEPYETPPAYADELSLILANSPETGDALVSDGVKKEQIEVFPNYVTMQMYEKGRENTVCELKRIAVVSNHVADELIEAIEMMRKQDYRIDIFGDGYTQILITEDVLINYDAVVTIGKTVQYALALSIPVYCYDIHGGPGWLRKENYLKASYLNFSGRGFTKKTSKDIYNELSDRSLFSESLAEIAELRGFVGDNNILEANIIRVLLRLEGTEDKHDLIDVLNSKYSAEARANKLVISLFRYNLYREMRIIDLEKEISDNRQAVDDLYRTVKTETAPDGEKSSEKISGSIPEMAEQIRTILTQQQAENCVSLNMKLKRSEKKSNDLFRLSIRNKKEISELKKTVLHKDNEISSLQDQIEKQKWLLSEIYKSKAWKLITLYRNIKIRIKNLFRKKTEKIPENNQFSDEIFRSAVPVISDAGNENESLVTVGIPVYDRTDVLRACIDSLIGQTYENIEIIAVCDGSPDETVKIIKEYEELKLIKAFYYPDNSGNAVRGRNKAIREASGKYFAFMDSDDVAEPDRIKLSVEQMKKYNADIVYGGWRAIVDGTREIDIKDGQEIFSPDCDYEMLKTVCVPCQSTVMAKTEALRAVGGLKTCMRYREDHELWLRLAYAGYKFKAVPEVLVNLRLHSGNLELAFKDEDNKWYDLMMAEHKRIVPFKPKIAYVIPGCGISGGIAVICQHLNRLKARGYDVIMISESEEREINWFPNQTVEIIGTDEVPGNIDALVATGWTTAYTVERIPAKEKYYFVQSDETRFSPEGTEAYDLARQSYSMDYFFFTEAKWIQRWLEDTYGKYADYVPNGLDETLIYCTEKREYPLSRKVRVLLEGPIDIPYKGMNDAFAAVQDLDCEVWCISSAGVPKAEWKCDRFFSKVPMTEMKYIYSQCDILLKMSRVEGFFGPPMEMMACGGTCVVGKVTGYDEYIVDGYNALVVEQGDIEGAHEALKTLIENETLRRELAENGKKTAAQWNWEDSIDMLEKVFMKNA